MSSNSNETIVLGALLQQILAALGSVGQTGLTLIREFVITNNITSLALEGGGVPVNDATQRRTNLLPSGTVRQQNWDGVYGHAVISSDLWDFRAYRGILVAVQQSPLTYAGTLSFVVTPFAGTPLPDETGLVDASSATMLLAGHPTAYTSQWMARGYGLGVLDTAAPASQDRAGHSPYYGIGIQSNTVWNTTTAGKTVRVGVFGYR